MPSAASSSAQQQRATFSMTLYAGMNGVDAEKVRENGFSYREGNNALKIGDDARNGFGVYTSRKKETAQLFAAKHSNGAAGEVIEMEVNMEGLTFVRHNAANNLHEFGTFTQSGPVVEQTRKASTRMGMTNMQHRLTARKALPKPDVVRGKTEGFGTEELVFVSRAAIQALTNATSTQSSASASGPAARRSAPATGSSSVAAGALKPGPRQSE